MSPEDYQAEVDRLTAENTRLREIIKSEGHISDAVLNGIVDVRRERDELRAVVEKLPKDAVGKPLVPGGKCYTIDNPYRPGEVCECDGSMWEFYVEWCIAWGGPKYGEIEVSECYVDRADAEAAAAALEGKA